MALTTLEQAGKAGFGDAMVQDSPNSRIVPPPATDGVKHLEFKPYGVGIDCHSRFIQVCVLKRHATETDKYEAKFGVTWGELGKARDWIAQRVGEVQFEYTLESTGVYHRPVLLRFQGKPSVVNPLLASPTRRKTDVLDAALLAYHALTGLWPQSYIVPLEIEQVRILLGERRNLTKQSLRDRNRINNILLRYGYTFGVLGWFTDDHSAPLLEDLINGRPFASPHSSGIPIPTCILRELRRLLSHSKAADEDARRLALEAEQVLRSLPGTALGGTCRDGSELLNRFLEVPGIGKVAAMTFIAEVANPHRFPNAKAVAAFCGCDPSVKISAGKVTSQTRRKGNAILHMALLHAGGSVLRSKKPCPLADWGKAIRGRNKTGAYKKAASAVARKLSSILWSMWLTGEPWQALRHGRRPVLKEQALTEILSPRVCKLLATVNIKTTTELLNQQAILATIPGLGQKALEEIKTVLFPTASSSGGRSSSEPTGTCNGKTAPSPS